MRQYVYIKSGISNKYLKPKMFKLKEVIASNSSSNGYHIKFF